MQEGIFASQKATGVGGVIASENPCLSWKRWTGRRAPGSGRSDGHLQIVPDALHLPGEGREQGRSLSCIISTVLIVDLLGVVHHERPPYRKAADNFGSLHRRRPPEQPRVSHRRMIGYQMRDRLFGCDSGADDGRASLPVEQRVFTRILVCNGRWHLTNHFLEGSLFRRGVN